MSGGTTSKFEGRKMKTHRFFFFFSLLYYFLYIFFLFGDGHPLNIYYLLNRELDMYLCAKIFACFGHLWFLFARCPTQILGRGCVDICVVSRTKENEAERKQKKKPNVLPSFLSTVMGLW